MITYRWIIGALWLTFVLVWLVTAFGAKRSVSGIDWWRQAQLRLALIVLILLVLRIPVIRHSLHVAHPGFVTVDPRLGIAGVILCALGVAIAIWARVHLGRNWGLPMSRKEAPELVTSGPYAYVRHPIYSGIFLAMIGSALGESVLWLIPFAVAGAYFIYAARTEEHILEQEFPEQYAAYRRHTKMLVPFVL
ncbi:MAG TPA: isoprenylcysteine carboxylmethyltransferase family protein [Candidatus Binatia bacterium]|nr:isoprenylcysteine carboxylmethyltransferase family protein [Candidatus Binatia bacterium]